MINDEEDTIATSSFESMGQSQLLLVILGVLLVGVAIYIGVSSFQQDSADSNRNAIINDLQNFAAQALVYYRKTVSQAGGGRSFEGITIKKIYPMEENDNARYFVESATSSECIIAGVGKIISGDDSVRVHIHITLQRNIIEIEN